MNNIDKRFLEAISTQATDNVPKLYIQDVVSGRVFEYGGNCHDRLLISEDGRSLTYYNLQNGDGSCVGDYRFYYEKPKIETEEDKRNAFDIDEWARMVKHQSISELLAEERKRVVGELKVDIRYLFNSYANSLLDYCIWNINAYTHKNLYNNFKRVINNRLDKV
jgi:hypothetical protein